jgi:hypothetical protein
MHTESTPPPAKKWRVAWLKGPPDEPASPCHVDTICPSGAKLKVATEADIPEAFELIFSRRGDARISCRMISRHHKDLEVQFVSAAQASTN